MRSESQLTLLTSEIIYAVCRLMPDAPLPLWLKDSNAHFISVTNTDEETSIICDQSIVPNSVQLEGNYRLLKVKGTLDFNFVGILKSIADPLAEAGISIFVLSTYDTDCVLVKADKYAMALEALEKNFKIEAHPRVATFGKFNLFSTRNTYVNTKLISSFAAGGIAALCLSMFGARNVSAVGGVPHRKKLFVFFLLLSIAPHLFDRIRSVLLGRSVQLHHR